MALIPSEEIVAAFRRHFGADRQPAVFRAPGRVNLIGEHTDYNLGFVFPIALEMACYVAIAPSVSGNLRMYSADVDEEVSIPVDAIAGAERQDNWSDYVVGVARELSRLGMAIESADLCVASLVPIGSGLSSSAALEISSAIALLGSRELKPLEIALVGQRAESQFVGVPVGVMDQYASVFGRENAAIQIDCRSLEHQYVPLPGNVSIVAVNSMVKHELGTSAYRQRVAECRQAVEALQAIDPEIQSLRDISMQYFVEVQERIAPIPRQRARHVVSDSQRVLDLGAAAGAGDLGEMGRLFVASHRSMQFDYEITCEEIDFLVDTAIKLPGVYGARMTGGGFGGCTVNLVAPQAVEAFRERLGAAYEARFSLLPAFYDCIPAAGAGLVREAGYPASGVSAAD